jgi:hypothetical protein
MLKKLVLAAALAVPALGFLPAAEARAAAPVSALQSTVQSVQSAADQHVCFVRTYRTVRYDNCYRNSYRVHWRHHFCR